MTDHQSPSIPTVADARETRPIPIPALVIPPHLVAGVYANQAIQIGTSNEVVIDFSAVVPDQVMYDEHFQITDITVTNQLVSRVIMPIDQFVSFIVACATRNPTIRNAVIATVADSES